MHAQSETLSFINWQQFSFSFESLGNANAFCNPCLAGTGIALWWEHSPLTNAGVDLVGGCSCCAPPPPLPEMTCSFQMQLVLWKKKNVCSQPPHSLVVHHLLRKILDLHLMCITCQLMSLLVFLRAGTKTGHGSQVTSHISLYYQYRNNPNRLRMLTLEINFLFSRPKVSFNECLEFIVCL